MSIHGIHRLSLFFFGNCATFFAKFVQSSVRVFDVFQCKREGSLIWVTLGLFGFYRTQINGFLMSQKCIRVDFFEAFCSKQSFLA